MGYRKKLCPGIQSRKTEATEKKKDEKPGGRGGE